MRPIVTGAEMRAAEVAAVDAGTPAEVLMEKAGEGAAEALWRFAGRLPALVVCGPGNNGGDGYVIARKLRERGVKVRVAALGEPQSPAGRQAFGRWDGPVEPFHGAAPAPLLVDALFGTGLSRPLEDGVAEALLHLAAGARVSVAVDLPSGAATDDGRLLSPVPDYDLTISFGALKPSHLLQPAARHMGRLVTADIGVDFRSDVGLVERPRLRIPGPDDHKYRRGYVALVEGEMPGAAALAAAAALKAGAGDVRLIGTSQLANQPRAVVQGGGDALKDRRIDALIVGPGLGRGPAAAALLDRAVETQRPLVVDADALGLLATEPARLRDHAETAILTPHAGEFASLFGRLPGSKIDQAWTAAERSGAVVVFKGPDTVIAAPGGRAAIALPSSSWLASAGTGDVLSGIIAAMRATGLPAFDAACAGVWLHARAAERAGSWLIADDLVEALTETLGDCS
jgi:hydroxyethylthiazole kinase-like uncharacterized protein yjeF